MVRSKHDDPPPHGTTNRYYLRGAPCRCAACREANTKYMREYRRRLRGRGGGQLPLPIPLLDREDEGLPDPRPPSPGRGLRDRQLAARLEEEERRRS